jgi:hypothetical protein
MGVCLNVQQRKTALLGFVGLLLIVLSLKFMLGGTWQKAAPLDVENRPAILFFSFDEPCECMLELTAKAEAQIAGWAAPQDQGIPVYRFDFPSRPDLASYYAVYRVPCLIYLDASGESVYRLDFSITEPLPFNLAGLEAFLPEKP